MTITPERKTELILDAVLERPSADLTRTEKKFREEMVAAANEIEKKGGIVEIPFELPDLPPKIKQFFNENHDELGRFTFGEGGGDKSSGGGTKSTLATEKLGDLVSRAKAEGGGFTYSPTTGKEPKKGFAVSPYPEREKQVPEDKFSRRSLTNYIAANKDMWGDSRNHIGAWHSSDHHKIFLDVSTVSKTRAAAEKVGREHQQYAGYDLAKGESFTILETVSR